MGEQRKLENEPRGPVGRLPIESFLGGIVKEAKSLAIKLDSAQIVDEEIEIVREALVKNLSPAEVYQLKSLATILEEK